jgi:hypothetical protein
MQLLPEQHVVAAKLVRESGARFTGIEREFFIKKSNSFVACARLSAKNRSGIHLESLPGHRFPPIGV